jgi:hypothetical protein
MEKTSQFKFMFALMLLSLSVTTRAYEMDQFTLKDASPSLLDSPEMKLFYMSEQALRRKAQKPEMSYGEGVAFMRNLSEYFAFVRLKRSNSTIPTFGEFNKDPLRYIREDVRLSREARINYYAANPSESFDHCRKTPLKQIVCPEGTYSFAESRFGSEVNNSEREPKDAPLTRSVSNSGSVQASDQ